MSIYEEMERQMRKNESVKNILATIKKGEFHIMSIHGKQSFLYTIGLYQLYEHPEILICHPNNPRSFEIVSGLLQFMGENVKKGQKYKGGEKYKGIFGNNHFAPFKSIEPKFYNDYLGTAISVYNNRSFPAIQCLFPDENGLFPGDPGCDENFRKMQTLSVEVNGH